MSRHALIESRPQTEAEADDYVLRQHLAALTFAAQEAADADALRLARGETHLLVSAVCAALAAHRLHPTGACTACGDTCALRTDLRRALLPVRAP
jgi:hypothetical protein